MKRRFITSLQSLLAAVLFLSAVSTAQAQLGLTFASGQTTYVAGQVNNFTFTAGNPANSWIDRLTITVPAAWTVNSVTPNSAVPGGCATEIPLTLLCSPSASWVTNNTISCGVGATNNTFCGWWNNGNITPTMEVNVPAGTTGPQTITANFKGESGTIQILSITLNAFVPPVPCALVCPANQFYNLDPGACTQVVNYNVTTTGTCQIVQQACGFIGSFAPASVDFWQVGGAAGTGLPPQGNSGNGPHVLFDDAGAACPATADRLTLRSVLQVGGFCHNGVEWNVGNTAPTNISFNWTYANPGANAWDRFAVGIGNNGPTPNKFACCNNNFCFPPGGFWQNITNQFGPLNAAGTFNGVLGVNATLAFSAWTTVAGFGPAAVITITNFTSTQTVPAVPVQISGLPSGSEFPIGKTTNCFRITADNLQGVPTTTTCCFDVTVIEFPNPISSLVCNDLVYVSLDEDCDYCLGADGVLEGGPYHCYDDYIVEVDKTLPYGNGPWVPACFNNSDVGKTYQVRVTDSDSPFNKCWGNVKIEDKLAPILDCPSALLPCNFPSFAPEYVQTATFTLKFAAAAGDLPKTLNPGQDFNFNIPIGVDAVVNDVDCRVLIQDALGWNVELSVISPAGTSAVIWDALGGCGLTEPLFARLDDEGLASNQCVDIGADLNLDIMSVFAFDALDAFDGENAEGNWVIRVDNVDAFGFGQSAIVEIAELYINLTGDFTAGFPNELGGNCVQALGNNQYRVPAGCGNPQLDNCSDVTLSYLDTHIPDDCASGLTGHINRKWTARDASGNTTTCVQRIDQLRPSLVDVIAPPDYDGVDAQAFDCTGSMPIVNGHPNPTPDWIQSQGLQGYPYVFGQPNGCSINWEWHDYAIEVCDGTVKYRREWTIIDWCIGDGFIYNQILKIVDEQGPAFNCPANLTVSTDPFACCATINLPDVIVEDNCSQINNISGMITIRDQYTGEVTNMVSIGGSLQSFPGNNFWDLDTLANFGWAPCLPIGTHTVMYVAEDDCGNTSSCNFNLTVRDYVPPVASCDETTTIAIGIDDPFDCYGPAGPNNTNPDALGACDFAGVTWVRASTFDDGSYDNCNGVKFTIRRMAPYSDCILALNATNGFLPCNDIFPDFPSEFERAISEGDSIKFYCCEVGTTQTVILSVYQVDVNGNIQVDQSGAPIRNECMIQVEVQDKLKPVCLSPANVTVNCENFDPSLWAYGKAQVADNCCLDQTKEYQGQCGLTHTVNLSNFDTVCSKGTITRTFRAFDCHGFSSQCTQRVIVTYEQDYFIKFPNDAIVTVCDGSGVYGEPTFFGEDCELLGVSYEDEVFTVVPDACFKIERTWTIINWCTYNPNAGCINVPNPNPNAITNAPANLPGPTVSQCGTLPPWKSTIVKINPTDPNPGTDYCTFWDKNANCYKYKQIIKIIDGQAPTGTFVVPDCSNANWFTPNNGQLWNEMYWWDNGIGSHDLCEEPTDLCITGTDACSGSNINIEYLLFLDLDGNGSMETVVNSVNTGINGYGWNTVWYNNLNVPNFGPGTPRQFDERPVPGNQKYGFAIQETVSGNSKTACVRWNTQQQQNTYVTPELPHGTHKIKWFLTDGCGNNKEYEYTFTVKDCKAPTVVCLNGLSVNIMPTGMIALWASDFLQYTEDNCTPTGQIQIGIRKCGTGTGFPVDANDNPITVVNFTCAELGTQCVELWARDAQRNADYCETYVIVQDNNGNCPNGSVNVAGVLKTEAADGVEEAVVNINGSVNFAPPFAYFDLSDNGGVYEVKNNVPVASTFVIAPEKDDNPLNGVTTYDLVLISKHILGIEPLSTPYKMIAADANKSGSITTFDIVELRKLILGIYTELPNNTSWRFVDKSFSFPNANNPFQTAFPETVSVADAQLHQFGEDFAGVKIGDVNGSAVANATMQAEERTAGTAIFDVADRNVKAGEEFEVSFTSAQAVKGFQFTATLNGLTAISTVDAENVTPDNFNLTPANAMAVSIDGAQGFTVRFRAEKAGKLSEMLGVSGSVTRAEAYGDAGRLNVAFRFDGKTIAGVGFELYQNQPNPFVNRTFVGFFLPEAAEATLSVFDETGRVVYQQKGQFAKGENTIALDRALINTTGVLFYKLETATDSATKKMIQAK
jgi:hypothetical protein